MRFKLDVVGRYIQLNSYFLISSEIDDIGKQWPGKVYG